MAAKNDEGERQNKSKTTWFRRTPKKKDKVKSLPLSSSIQLSKELVQSPSNHSMPTEVWFDVSSSEDNTETISQLKEDLKEFQKKFEDEEKCRKNAERLCEDLTREQEALRSELKLAEEDSEVMQSLYEVSQKKLSFYESSENSSGPRDDVKMLSGEFSVELEDGQFDMSAKDPSSINLQMVQELESIVKKERIEKRDLFDSTQTMREQVQEKKREIEEVRKLLKQKEEECTEMSKLLNQKEDEMTKMNTKFKELLEEKTCKHEESLQTISRFENELLSVEAQLSKERQEKYEQQKKIISMGSSNRKLNERIESCHNRIETYLNQLQILERENKELSRSKGTLEESNEDFRQALQCLHDASVKINNGRPASFNAKDYNSQPEMRDFLNWVAYGIVDKWQSFAYQLKLSEGTVKIIMATYGSKPLDCCRELFIEWKNNKTSSFTWSTILTALLSPSVGRHFIASLVVTELDRIHYC